MDTESIEWWRNGEHKLTHNERWFGDCGFRVFLSVNKAWVDFSIYEIKWTDNGQDVYETEDCHQTTSLKDAECYLNGFIKWDGCTELISPQYHFCGPDQYQKHADLLKLLYLRCMDLMQYSESEYWPPTNLEIEVVPPELWTPYDEIKKESKSS